MFPTIMSQRCFSEFKCLLQLVWFLFKTKTTASNVLILLLTNSAYWCLAVKKTLTREPNVGESGVVHATTAEVHNIALTEFSASRRHLFLPTLWTKIYATENQCINKNYIKCAPRRKHYYQVKYLNKVLKYSPYILKYIAHMEVTFFLKLRHIFFRNIRVTKFKRQVSKGSKTEKSRDCSMRPALTSTSIRIVPYKTPYRKPTVEHRNKDILALI